MPALPPALVLVLAVLAGSAMDATIKHLTHTNHVLIVALGRYAFGAMFSLGVWAHAGAPSITAGMWRAHALRGAIIACSGTGFFWSFSVLPLAEAITLSFVGALMIPFVARLMLGERLRRSSVFAAVLGFAGVIIAAQGAPSADESPLHALGVAAVLASAVLFSAAMVIMRSRAQSDGPAIAGLMSSLMPGLVLAGPAIALAPPPLWSDWAAFLLMGAFAALFMSLLAHAYAAAEAQQLAPLHYTELLWATAFGYFLFQETPRPQIFLGALFIIAAGLYAAYDERRISRRLRG